MSHLATSTPIVQSSPIDLPPLLGEFQEEAANPLPAVPVSEVSATMDPSLTALILGIGMLSIFANVLK